MKTSLKRLEQGRPVASLLFLASLSLGGCYKPQQPTVAEIPSPRPVVTDATPGNRIVVAANPDEAPTRWTDIKDYPFDQRERFFAGLDRLRAGVEAQVSELRVKRASMNSTVDTKAWDFNMKEMDAARSYLNGVADELRKATPETWDQGKEKAGQAWTRAQEAFDKVKSSTTS